MHALVVRVSLSEDDAASLKQLTEEVVPFVSQLPGFVTGYWVRLDGEREGTSVIAFESEENAQAAKERFQPPEGVTLQSAEVGEVVAQA
jgi:hypothetical protein